ncbi:MAG: amidohydrolase family protein [Pseudomonadota bacterium]
MNIIFFVIGLVLCSCSQKSIKTDSLKIFDAHLHFNSKKLKTFNQPSQTLLDEFQKNSVIAGVVHLTEEENFKVVVDQKGAVKWKTCVGLHENDTVKKVEKGIKEGRFQCIKVYLGYVPKWATDPFYRGFYRLAQKYQLPVVFHTGDTYDKMAKVKYADPLQIDELAVEFPKVKFVIAHMGNPWFNSAAEVVYKNENVFVDVSGLILGDISQMTDENIEEVIIKPVKWFYAYVENPKKFLYGSDWPLVEMRSYIELMKKIIPEKDWQGFFHDNAREVFGY